MRLAGVIVVLGCLCTPGDAVAQSEQGTGDRGVSTAPLPFLPKSGPRLASPRPRQQLLDMATRPVPSARPTVVRPDVSDRAAEIRRLIANRNATCEVESSCPRTPRLVTGCTSVDQGFACVRVLSGASILVLSEMTWQTGCGTSIFRSTFCNVPHGSAMVYGDCPSVFTPSSNLARRGVIARGITTPVGMISIGRYAAAATQSQGYLEEATNAMSEGRIKDSIALFTSLTVQFPTDARILRALAIAQAADGDVSSAADTLMRSYLMNVGLCADGMSAQDFGFSSMRWRELLRQAVVKGHSSDRPEIWFFAATLMQAEGRVEPARRMLNRAIESGLDRDLARHMTAAL